jgi:hypothetical protein
LKEEKYLPYSLSIDAGRVEAASTGEVKPGITQIAKVIIFIHFVVKFIVDLHVPVTDSAAKLDNDLSYFRGPSDLSIL